MRIATLLFAYNRSTHIKRTIEALHKNIVLPDKLFIFHDGLKHESHRQEWSMVKNIIYAIDWCDTEVVEAKTNKGLAKSIVDGINRAFTEYDAVIVLEDDCVSHPVFMDYMIKCLNKYRDNKKVFSVNGYSWNADVPDNGTDAYFVGRAGSWGWATWKDRWDFYIQDYKLIAEMKSNPEINCQLNIWGQDLENYLIHNIDGQCDSWTVFWALQCIRRGGFCPTPYYSLIDNIGFDGTGVHCGNTDLKTNMRNSNNMKEITLPETLEFPDDYENIYSGHFKWVSPETKLTYYNELLLHWIMMFQKGIKITKYFEENSIHTIAVWGRGNLCKILINELKGKVNIKYIIESDPIDNEYEYIPVIGRDKITNEVQLIVVIPAYDMSNIHNNVKYIKKPLLIGLDEILNQC